jgi:hypothetical protein
MFEAVERKHTMPVKLTVNLPEDTVEGIRKIAEEKGMSMTETLRQVLDNERFLHDELKKGHKLLLEKNKSFREVLLPTAPR